MTNVLRSEKLARRNRPTLIIGCRYKIYTNYITTDSIYIMAQAGSSDDIARAIEALAEEVRGTLQSFAREARVEAEQARIVAAYNNRVKKLERQVSKMPPRSGLRDSLLRRIASIREMIGTAYEVRPVDGQLDPDIEELLSTAQDHIRELEEASTLSFAELIGDDKDRLQAIINNRGEFILSQHFGNLIGHLPAQERERTIKHKLVVYLLVFLDLSAELLPKFFGVNREQGMTVKRLYIPDQSTEEGKLQVDHALTAVIMHMSAPRSLFESMATAIQAEYNTVGGFLAAMGFMAVSSATASAASPLVASFLGTVGATRLAPGDIIEIFRYVATNVPTTVGYLGAAAMLYNKNKATISRAGWAIFDHTIGAGGAPREPPPPFVQVFDRMNDQFMQQSVNAVVGEQRDMPTNPLTAYLYLARLARTACVTQLENFTEAFVAIPKLLRKGVILCKKGFAHVKDHASLLAHRLESEKGIRSNETYYSFRECLYGAAKLRKFAPLMRLPEVHRCFSNMNVHVPDPFMITRERVNAHAARVALEDVRSGVRPIQAPTEDSMGVEAGESQNTVDSVTFDRDDGDIFDEYGGVLDANMSARSHTPGPLSREGAISLAAMDALRTRQRPLRLSVRDRALAAPLPLQEKQPSARRHVSRSRVSPKSKSKSRGSPKSKSNSKGDKKGGSTRRHKAKITKKHRNNRTKLQSRRKQYT